MSANRQNSASEVNQPQVRGPALRPDLDMNAIIAAPPHREVREVRTGGDAPYPPVLNGEHGLWWA